MNWRRLLYPLSLLYATVTGIRNKLFDAGILKSVTFDIPVICVGNLKAGGEGKTPHIEYLIRLLKPQYKLATLSRGYKRKTKHFVLADDNSTAADIGDEPLQFKHKFPDIAVAVDAERALGITLLLGEEENLQVILLDDAYQHRYVKAGLNILLTGYQQLYCDDMVLPAGNLRESTAGAARADLIIVTKCPPALSALEQQVIKKKLNPTAQQKVFFTSIVYGNLSPLQNNGSPLPSASASCLLLTGIANPRPMLDEVKKQFASVHHMAYSDHHRFTKYDLQTVKKKLDALNGEGKFVLTTEKDAMRLQAPELQPYLKDIPLYYLPIEVKPLADENLLNDQILTYVRQNSGNN